MGELRHLNLGMNRLSRLPNRFHEISQLELLDLTYNNFTEEAVGTMFWEANTPLSKESAKIFFFDFFTIYLVRKKNRKSKKKYNIVIKIFRKNV